MTIPSQTSEPTAAIEEHVSGALVVKLALSWALVGIPLAWGVWQVFKKSLDLFR